MRRPIWMLFMLFALIAAIANGDPATTLKGTGMRYDEIPDGAYSVVAEVRAKPGKERELREVTLTLVAQVRAEPNNILYFLHEDREAPAIRHPRP